MRLFGQVVKTRPGYDSPIGGWPYQGRILDVFGRVITDEIGGMSEEQCREAIALVARRIRNSDFVNSRDIFEILEKEEDNATDANAR